MCKPDEIRICEKLRGPQHKFLMDHKRENEFRPVLGRIKKKKNTRVKYTR